jgi:hypothetical protein
LSKHTAFAVTLPIGEAGGTGGNTNAVAFQPFSVAKGLDAVAEAGTCSFKSSTLNKVSSITNRY